MCNLMIYHFAACGHEHPLDLDKCLEAERDNPDECPNVNETVQDEPGKCWQCQGDDTAEDDPALRDILDQSKKEWQRQTENDLDDAMQQALEESRKDAPYQNDDDFEEQLRSIIRQSAIDHHKFDPSEYMKAGQGDADWTQRETIHDRNSKGPRPSNKFAPPGYNRPVNESDEDNVAPEEDVGYHSHSDEELFAKVRTFAPVNDFGASDSEDEEVSDEESPPGPVSQKAQSPAPYPSVSGASQQQQARLSPTRGKERVTASPLQTTSSTSRPPFSQTAKARAQTRPQQASDFLAQPQSEDGGHDLSASDDEDTEKARVGEILTAQELRAKRMAAYDKRAADAAGE